MATTEVPHVSDKTEQAEGVNGVQDGVGAQRSEGSSTKPADEASAPPADKPASMDVSLASQDPSLGAASARANSFNGSASGIGSSTPVISMPHPKKFSHVDINKRFLGKNSPASSVGNATSPSNANKPGLSIQKPAIQTTVTHSKLVTAKLTTDIQRTATTGPGWSRPPSTSSSLAAAPSASATTPAPVAAPVHTAPQPPAAGKVIQPQPRGAAEAPPIVRKDSTGKSAWGNARQAAASLNKLATENNEFPTAAEVAQGRMPEKKPTPQPTAAQKQAAVDADAFRGVHLGPNVHHWDEDEGDDSNFLDEVIQFEDGKQYTVQHTQEAQPPPSPQAGSDVASRRGETIDEPVSKEERFADDFDRSWPPSRGTRGPSQTSHPPTQSPTPSSPSVHSPQDASRVLFNERSNRLEPYSSSRFSGPPRDSYLGRRGSRADAATSPIEPRTGREGPQTQGVQLLQKPALGGRDQLSSEERGPRSRMSGDRPGFAPQHDGSFRDRDQPRRDYGGPSHMARTNSRGFDHMRSRDQYDHAGAPPDRPRRTSTVGSPLVASPSDITRDGRQLPPHLSGSHQQSGMWRPPSTATRPRRQSTASSVGGSAAQQSAQSPASSHALLSPNLADTSPQPLAASLAVDIDEVRKAAMHSAAERARLRRQQEEAEREKERERARQKAAELEAKMKAAEEDTARLTAEKKPQGKVGDQISVPDSEVVSIIESAVQSAIRPPEPPPIAASEERTASATKSVSSRAPSTRGVPRPPRQQSGVDASSLASDGDSWRSKTVSRPLVSRDSAGPVTSPTAAPLPALPLLAHVDHLAIVKGETLEVVDFAEHGKLVGVLEEEPTAAAPPSTNGVSRRPQRPVATDFFQDQDETQGASPVEGNRTSWRRRSSAAYEQPSRPLLLTQGLDEHPYEAESPRDLPRLQISSLPHDTSPTSTHTRHPLPGDDGERRHAESLHGDPGHPLRSPQAHTYREAPMSALTDTMARIKGALDGMHKPEPKQKWLPPAKRTRNSLGDPAQEIQPKLKSQEERHLQEIFDVTGYELPGSPKPAWNHFVVRLPRSSHSIGPVSPSRLRFFVERRHLRLDVCSIGPLNANSHRTGLQLNDILFSRPVYIRGVAKFEVKLPQSITHEAKALPSQQPVVKLPSKSAPPSQGAFGRSREADGATSWRRLPSSPLRPLQNELLDAPAGELDTISRSPPPEAPAATTLVNGQAEAALASPVITVPPPKLKTQSKALDTSGVAFYRDSPTDATTVKFIVNSELEEDAFVKYSPVELSQQATITDHGSLTSFPTLSTVSIQTPPSEPPLRPEPISSAKDPIVEFRKGNRSPVQAPITPPTHAGNLPSLTWAAQREANAKESPSRLPDPEHLKAVWSSTSNKAENPSANSLKGIADDLPSVPLTMQDAKLENIPTPPPHSTSHASRMSIMHDITRTFQQVPISSASATHSAKLGTMPLPASSNAHPSTMTSPSQRPHQLPPAMPAGMRVPYPGYPSPMLSSPSPTLIYPPMTPSPIPAQMVINGQYPPPPTMWMALPPPPNGPPGMMRPMASPYGHQLMPYPHAGTMYHNMQSHAMSQSTGVQGRPGNVMMTPQASQAQPGHPQPMYATSPVVMHAMAAMPGPGANYPGSAQGRGPPHPRGPYDNVPGMQQSPSFGPQQSPGYSVPPNMFVRSAW